MNLFITYLLPFMVGLIPLIIWLTFFLLRDWKKPEPAKIIIQMFLVGITSAILAFGIETIFSDYTKNIAPLLYNLFRVHNNVWAFLMVAIVEEIMKFAVIFFGFRKGNHFCDEAIDPMIYMIVCAIGFSSVENYFAVFNKLASFIDPLDILTARFIGANLLHIICSGVIGFFWSLQIRTKKKFLLPLGIIIAVVFHTFFNTLIFTYGIFAILILFVIVFVSASILLWLFDYIEDVPCNN